MSEKSIRPSMVTILIGLLLIVVIVPLPSHATAPALVITSSSIPSSFTGENFTFIATANAPVTTWSITGENVGVNYTSGSTEAVVYGHPSAGAQTVTLTASTSGYTSAVQKWTLVTYPLPFIWSIPAFSVNVNQTYDYQPSGSACAPQTFPCPITWSFSGAPYLSVDNKTGALSGIVMAGTYENALTVHDVAGNYTQYWTISTAGVPSEVNVTCPVADNGTLDGVVSLTDGFAAGCGSSGVFSGERILLYTGNTTGNASHGSYQFSDTGNTGYTMTGTSSHHFGLYFYSTPNVNFTPVVNGVSDSAMMPSSGFYNLSFDPSNNTSSSTTAPGLSLPSLSSGIWLLVGAAVFIILLVAAILFYHGHTHSRHRRHRK